MKLGIRGTILPFAVKKGSEALLELESRGRGAVVRFWGCNLRCPLCFAQSYAFRNEERSRRRFYASMEELRDRVARGLANANLPELRWLRIEGGEPLASTIHAEFVSEIVKAFAKEVGGGPRPRRLIIQTNGVWLGKELDNARSFYGMVAEPLVEGGLKVAVEISFKGPNEGACEAYSGVKGAFKLQCSAFKNSLEVLEGYWREGANLSVHPVAGFGPSLKELIAVPLDPQALERGSEKPLFHQGGWSAEFKEVAKAYFKAMESRKARTGNTSEPTGGASTCTAWSFKAGSGRARGSAEPYAAKPRGPSPRNILG